MFNEILTEPISEVLTKMRLLLVENYLQTPS